MLQEFLQCTRLYQAPQQRSALQWQYESRPGTALVAAEFRATVSFLLDGVPHHVVGVWHASKKKAQRDTAERTLGLYVGRWGAEAVKEQLSTNSTRESKKPTRYVPAEVPGREARLLEDYCRSSPACAGGPTSWSARWESGLCCASLEVTILGVPHTFSGAWCTTMDAARADTARRVLWYLQCPGFQLAFEPDPQAPAVAAQDIPVPPSEWAGHVAAVAGGNGGR